MDQKVSEYNQEIPKSHTRPTHGTVRKSHRTFTETIHLYDNNSQATSFLKMIAKLEWAQSNAQQNKDKHITPTTHRPTRFV